MNSPSPRHAARGSDASVLRLFEEKGVRLPSGGNAPFLLEDPTQVWLVAHGEVNVFAVNVVDDAPEGARHYLFTAREGALLPGVEPAWADEVGLLSVGVGGAELLRLPIETLLVAWGEAGAGAKRSLSRKFEEYVLAFASAVATRNRPQVDVLLEPGDEPTTEAGLRLSARRGVAWTAVQDGALWFTGDPRLTVEPGPTPFPVPLGAWMEPAEGTSIKVYHEDELHDGRRIWAGVRRFQRVALEWVDLVWRNDRAEETDRLRRRVEADRMVGQVALESLAGVMAGERQPDVDPGASLMLRTCRMVGDALGVDFRPAASWERGRGTMSDELRAIARASGVGYRKVVLTGGWWAHDNGPLIGFVREASDDLSLEEYTAARVRPVAFLPSDPSSYTVSDPESGRTEPIDAERAESFEPFGYQVYRSLPPRMLSAGDLWRFVTFGVGRDVRTLVLMGLLGAVLGLLLPVLTGTVFDTIIPSADRLQLVNVFAALVVAAIAITAFQLTRSFASLRFQTRVQASLQMAVIDRLVRLPLPFFRRFTAGDLALRASGITVIGRTLGGATITSILSSMTSAGAFVLLFYYSVSLALVATLILVVNVLFLTGTSYFALRYARELEEVEGRLSGLVLELLGGIAKLRVAGAEVRAFSRWASEFRRQQELGYRYGLFDNGVEVFNSLLSIGATLVLYGAYVALAGDPGSGLTTGQFLAFNAAFGMFMGASLSLTGTAIGLVGLIPTWERARPILETVPEVDFEKPDPGELTGRIEVSHLTFRYVDDGPLILDDVSVEAGPGEFVALVGPSGAGKSTLLRILLGFDMPESSSVYFDGHDLAGVDITAIRRQIGVVLQSSRLTAGDIYSNIVGSGSFTLEDAWEAVRMAGMEDDIQAMPMGMHTVVSEGGGTLSGGQRQRLLIARALVSRPRILFFDEATSALDNRAQQIVSESIDQLHSTRIVIAHRMSTVRNADRIYVLDRGRVAQAGTYEELVAVPGLFADLAARQEA